MTDPKRPSDAELKAEAAEFRRFVETDLVPLLVATPRPPLPQFMAQVAERLGMASAKAGLASEQGVSPAAQLPTSEQTQRWEAEVGAFFDALKTEFPATYRDPAFRAALLARLSALVKQLMTPNRDAAFCLTCA